jgi:hypothetical protein
MGPFDAVITNQAVHELRHKRHAARLHAAVKEDHFFEERGLGNDQLNMTVAEQRDALLCAGFSEVALVVTAGSLVMHRAT